MGINPRLSDPRRPGTSKLNWRYLEQNKIETNSQKGTGTKMAEKLNNLKKIQIKKHPILALFSTQRPPDDWPDALDHLAIGLVANKYTKLGKKIVKPQGLSYIKIPLC